MLLCCSVPMITRRHRRHHSILLTVSLALTLTSLSCLLEEAGGFSWWKRFHPEKFNNGHYNLHYKATGQTSDAKNVNVSRIHGRNKNSIPDDSSVPYNGETKTKHQTLNASLDEDDNSKIVTSLFADSPSLESNHCGVADINGLPCVPQIPSSYGGASADTFASSFGSSMIVKARRQFLHGTSANSMNIRVQSKSQQIAAIKTKNAYERSGLVLMAKPLNLNFDTADMADVNIDVLSSVIDTKLDTQGIVANEKTLEVLTQDDVQQQLQEETVTHDSSNKESDKMGKNATMSKSTTVLHTFHYPPANITVHGLSVSFPQFRAWVRYNLQLHDKKRKKSKSTEEGVIIEDPIRIVDDSEDFVQYVTSKDIDALDADTRDRLREEWFARRLICDRTELLTIYPSERRRPKGESNHSSDETQTNGAGAMPANSGSKRKRRRGGFADLLNVYCERLMGIMKDEGEDGIVGRTSESTKSSSPQLKPTRVGEKSFDMKTWLEENYGKRRVEKLMIDNFKELPLDRQKNVMLHLLHWFRERYPYYYDKCGTCGASYRDDAKKEANATAHDGTATNAEVNTDVNASTNGENSDEGTVAGSDLHHEETMELQGSFLGYCYPDWHELEGKAARTELYQCHSCGEFTRFPRYNAAKHIVHNGGRGRCGEYSILLYRMLRSVGHEARWVVDWADHVWAECWIGGRWVHLDPCEAAYDHPLLYEEWGKEQTYIIAFWMPLLPWNLAKSGNDYQYPEGSPFPLIQDVTKDYTSDSENKITDRRGESIDEAVSQGKDKLLKLLGEFQL